MALPLLERDLRRWLQINVAGAVDQDIEPAKAPLSRVKAATTESGSVTSHT